VIVDLILELEMCALARLFFSEQTTKGIVIMEVSAMGSIVAG
jgi:hypothetical protein